MNTYPSPHPQVAFKPKTAGIAIASLVCGILAFCIPLLPGLVGIILGIVAIRKINASNGTLGGKGLAIGGLVCSGLGTVIVTLLILPAMLLPALARAKNKANRVKCTNNCKQQYTAMLGFAQDNAERLPWQLSPSGVRGHLDDAADFSSGYGARVNNRLNEVRAHPSSLQTAGVFGMESVKSELGSPKILHSPVDPGRAADSEIVQQNWRSYDTKADGVSFELGNGISYTLIRGADTQRPSSVLLTTRNWSDSSLNQGRWLGADRDRANDRAMAGLNFSQGQLVQMDGVAKQSTNADLGSGGFITRQAEQGLGGVSKGITSLNILRGAGLE